MTRATLLQLLAQPTALNGADVRALEELAAAFPYCQTAHLLLAKAAHDQGSMLAGQRLRRAAAYAADRTLLRQLIELPAPALAATTTPALAEAPVAQPVAAAGTDQPYPPLPVQPPGSSTFSAEEPEVIDNQNAKLLVDLPEQVLVPVAPAIADDLPEVELPPQAPPVRPPAEAQAASTEFGLAEVSPVEITAYQLPELAESTEDKPPVGTPLLPPFSGLADVSYAPAEGSRLGFCLLPMGSSELPATSLPPAGEFFAPDAALLAHLAAQQPALPKASSLDLISSFLQRAPAAARRRAAPLPDEEEAQADLSVRSTRAELDLASESLAKILARQGKVDRATAIYERLMVKHPEKMAYFAAQIDSLRPTA